MDKGIDWTSDIINDSHEEPATSETSVTFSSVVFHTVFNLPLSILLYVLYTDVAHTTRVVFINP
jgi:hypothetical protein